jgi:hypothetical protein
MFCTLAAGVCMDNKSEQRNKILAHNSRYSKKNMFEMIIHLLKSIRDCVGNASIWVRIWS